MGKFLYTYTKEIKLKKYEIDFIFKNIKLEYVRITFKRQSKPEMIFIID